MLTVQQGIDRITRQKKRVIGEVSNQLWFDFFEALNFLSYEALAMIQPDEYIKQVTIDVVANKQAYLLPTDLKWMRSQSAGGETGFYKGTQKTGDITAMTDAGGGQITVTANHNILEGGSVIHTDFADVAYNGTFTAINVTSTSYEITAVFTATGLGIWTNEIVVEQLPQLEQTGFGRTDTGYYRQNGQVYFTPTPIKDEKVILRYIPTIARITSVTDLLVINEEHLKLVMEFLMKEYGEWNLQQIIEVSSDQRFAREFKNMLENIAVEPQIYII